MSASVQNGASNPVLLLYSIYALTQEGIEIDLHINHPMYSW